MNWLVFLAVILVMGAIADAVEKHRKRHPGRVPKEPADISPFTVALFSGRRERAYRPAGVYAVTPGGVRVHVRCPHVTGHRSPGLAVQCGEREKARIETYGR